MQLEVTVGYNHDVANESKYMHIAETWGGGNLELVSFHYESNWTQVAFAPIPPCRRPCPRMMFASPWALMFALTTVMHAHLPFL